MIKKKVKKGSKAVKKTAKKGQAKNSKKTPGEVRKDLAKLVKSHARKMAQGLIGQGETGQLAPVKYLLEMAHIYPEVNDGSEASRDEDCLAKTLLERLDVPTKPIELDEEPDFVIPAKKEEAVVVAEEEEPVGV